MIIGCEKCGTRFRVEDDAVTGEGTRFRCSRCRHIFTVHPRVTETASVPPKADVDKPSVGAEARIIAKARAMPEPDDDFDDFLSDIDEEFFEDDFMDSRKHKRPRAGKAGKTESPPADTGFDFTGFSSGPGKKRPSFIRRAVRVLLLLILLGGVAGGGALYFLFPEFIPEVIHDYIPIPGPQPEVQVQDMGVSRLALAGVGGSFVESEKAGNLFVIRGNVRNEFPGSRSFIQVQGRILDDGGKLVEEAFAYAGNALSDEELDGMSSEDIARAMNNSYGTDGMNRNVRPGSAIPFAIVFENLPENVAEFTVEPFRSFPGTS